MPVIIGTCGWQYRHWSGCFYPTGLPQRDWLAYYAERFAAVEIDSAFYRLPSTHSFEQWAEQTPPDFTMAVKASRYLTHMRRLRDPADAVSRLMERASHLGTKLGPILLQLPRDFALNVVALDETLEAFPAGTKVAFEPRHPSWYVEATARVLADHDAALCLSDSPGWRCPMWRTTSWGYLRFHHGHAQPTSCYGRSALRTWASRVAELWPDGNDVYAFFNNDAFGCAVRDAHAFSVAILRTGLRVARVASAAETRACGHKAIGATEQ